MGQDSKFERLVSKVPIDNDKLIGQAVGWFIGKQQPESVEFTQYQNGYTIEVRADGESAKEAREFWEEHVSPELGGNE